MFGIMFADYNCDVAVPSARCAVWEWARRSTRGERAACGAALLALALGAALWAALGARGAPPGPPADVAPHAWNVTRAMWLARPEAAASPAWPALPLRLVVVQHTAGAQCHRFADCAATLRALQQYYLAEFGYDLPYNFLVGNEGRVYEGRGWEGAAPHTLHYNLCALGLGFVGNYAAAEGGARPSALQLDNAARALRSGVARGALHARHAVLAARDLQPTDSPGDALYLALRRLPNFIADPRRFFNKSCEYIYAELDKIDFDPLPADPAPPDAA